jgi:hypothetical protein
VKLASRTTGPLPVTTRQAIQEGWHIVVATVDHPETRFCVEVERVDGARFAGRVVWHPTPYRDEHGIELGDLVDVAGWEYLLDAHPASEHEAVTQTQT